MFVHYDGEDRVDFVGCYIREGRVLVVLRGDLGDGLRGEAAERPVDIELVEGVLVEGWFRTDGSGFLDSLDHILVEPV